MSPDPITTLREGLTYYCTDCGQEKCEVHATPALEALEQVRTLVEAAKALCSTWTLATTPIPERPWGFANDNLDEQYATRQMEQTDALVEALRPFITEERK
jgi:hypothetical protein